MTLGVTFRTAAAEDEAFLHDMLYEAICWGPHLVVPREEAFGDPRARAYLRDWKRPGDDGLLALTGDEPVGAVWWRLYRAGTPAYGFVAGDVPELAIGVVAPWRGRGVGRALLRAALERAGVTADAVSLAVDHDNPARALYLSEGFRVVESREGADTMILELPAPNG